MDVQNRLKLLEDRIPKIAYSYENDRSVYNSEAANWYNLFRETWEAIIEEIVFNNTIRRFSREVQTLRLKMVELIDEDYKTIDTFMDKASEWMIGHDKSKELSVNRPGPIEIKKDLSETREFIKVIKSRRKETEERRKKLLTPQPSIIG